MKKVISLFLLAALMIALVSPAKAAGLDNFNKTMEYGNSFSDVPSGSWYAAGVKSAFEFGVMTGVGNSKFAPDSVVSMAQAVTVAARVHAQYNGYTIPDAVGEWYQKYVQYAVRYNLLPPDTEQTSDLMKPATRAFIAYVFSKAIASADLPAINTAASMPDSDSIPATYKDAVLLMNKGGIITGQDGNYFNPEGQATRAQMSVIIMRLLEPSERVSSDPNIDPYIFAQESNIMNSVPIFNGENGTKFVACENPDGSSDFIYTKNNIENIYSYKNPVGGIIIQGKYVYFIKHDKEVMTSEFVKFDPTTQKSEVLFEVHYVSGASEMIENITLYNRTFYLYISRMVIDSDANLNFTTKIYSVTPDGVSKELISIDTAPKDILSPIDPGNKMANKIAAFNNSLYFDFDQTLYSWDLNGSGPPKALRANIYEWVMSGNTVFYSDRQNNIGKFAANYSDLNKVLASIPSKTNAISICYANGALYLSDDTRDSTIYKFDGLGLVPICKASKKAWHIGISGDTYFYSNRSTNWDVNALGRMGSLVTISNIKSLHDWFLGE